MKWCGKMERKRRTSDSDKKVKSDTIKSRGDEKILKRKLERKRETFLWTFK